MEPTTISSTLLRLDTRDLLERVKFRDERFIVETFGRPMAVLISYEDFQKVRAFLENSSGAGDRAEEYDNAHNGRPRRQMKTRSDRTPLEEIARDS